MRLPAPEWSNEWRCESCGNPVDLDKVILEEEYGFEGEAWGTFFRSTPVTQALSPCCRAFIVNNVGNFLSADLLDNKRYW